MLDRRTNRLCGQAILCFALLLTASASTAFGQQKRSAAPLKFKGAKPTVFKKVGDVELYLYLFFPAEHKSTDRTPAIVFFFGGGWNGGSPKQFAEHSQYLASRGMVAAVADYRVASRHKTTPFECVSDGKSAVRWLRESASRLGIDPNRIAAGGGSAGGHVAAATGNVPGLDEPKEDPAVSSKPNALALFNPVYDNGPSGYGYSRVKDRYQEISPMHNIRKGAPPTIVFLGDKDKLVPVSTAKTYQKKMEAVGSRCDLHVYKNQPHGFFNRSKSNQHFLLTVGEMDRFLVDLGYLQGEPTIDKWKSPEGQ